MTQSKENMAYYRSPIGTIKMTSNGKEITSLDFVDGKIISENTTNWDTKPMILQECFVQVDEYFKGEREVFSVKIIFNGTEFQEKVWKELLNIPFGQTRSYLDIAEKIGDRNATRAVGSANGKNRIAIIVPCHRVIGNDRKLTGYAGGIWRKKWLLEHERKNTYKNKEERE